VGATLSPSETLDEPLTFQVQRTDVEALGGYRFDLGSAAIDLEMRAVLELSSRRTDPKQGLDPSGDSTRMTFALSPRVRGEYLPVEVIGLFIDSGLSFFLTNFRYITEGNSDRVVLSGHWVRLDVRAGLALYL